MKITKTIKKTLGTKFFRVSFIKKDGSFRELSARQVPDQAKKPGHWLVFDNVARTYKTIIKRNILMIKSGNKVFTK